MRIKLISPVDHRKNSLSIISDTGDMLGLKKFVKDFEGVSSFPLRLIRPLCRFTRSSTFPLPSFLSFFCYLQAVRSWSCWNSAGESLSQWKAILTSGLRVPQDERPDVRYWNSSPANQKISPSVKYTISASVLLPSYVATLLPSKKERITLNVKRCF